MAYDPSTRQRTADLAARSVPPIDPVPADYPPQLYHRDSWHYAAPTFGDNGWEHPRQAVSRPDGVTGRTRWGRYRLVVGRRDRSHFRGVPVVISRWTHASPRGLRSLVVRWTQISPFEHPGHGDIDWLNDHAKVLLQKVKDDGTIDGNWNLAGIIHSFSPFWTENGYGLEMEVKGVLHQGSDANNRPTKPAGPMASHDIGHRIPHRYNEIVGRKFKRIPPLNTGITEYKKGSLDLSVLEFTDQLLAMGWNTDGLQWSLMDRPAHPWQSHLVLPDPDTVDYTLALGTEGVEFDLDEDNDELPNVVYGEWVTPDGRRTQNLKYPHLRPDAAPGFPLGLGASFTPGGTDSGFRPFSRWLDRNGYTIFSDDTYDARDQDEVEDAQDRMGVPITGDVNANTWGTAFQADMQHAFSDSIYLPIAWDHRVEPYLYTPDGVKIGKNPDYDPSIPRRETFVNFGENAHRSEVKAAAKQIVQRSHEISLVGRIVTRSDPEECSFRDMRGGTTLNVPYLYNQADGVKFHLAEITVTEDDDGGQAELLVDTKWRDAYTVRQIHERNRDARHSPSRMRKQNASGLTQDTKPVFDGDNGAGVVFEHDLTGGEWRIVKMAAGAWGTFVRVHAETNDETEFALMLFSDKVTARFCERYVGDPLASDHPYKPNADVLKDAGLIQAWGSQAQPCGYSKPGAADGYKSDSDPLTGRFEWDSPLSWWSDRAPILYLAERAAASTVMSARFYNEPVDF